MQLVSVDNSTYKYSEKLINAAFLHIYERTKEIKFESIINFNKAKKLLSYFGSVIIFCFALFAFVPGLKAASNRLINFNQDFIQPPKFVFEIEPG